MGEILGAHELCISLLYLHTSFFTPLSGKVAVLSALLFLTDSTRDDIRSHLKSPVFPFSAVEKRNKDQ
jgi:hypothetical protein